MEKAMKGFALCGVLLALFLCFSACGPKRAAPKAELDTPDHHVANGNKLLAAEKYADAQREFDRALELDPKYAPAHVGTALVSAYQDAYPKALDALKRAEKYAKTDAQKAEADVGLIRVHALGQAKIADDWLDKAKDAFQDAVKRAPQTPAPYYFMGTAYKQACAFGDASAMFSKAISLKGEYVGAADKEYAEVQKIERAMPGTAMGKKIALVKELTRADAAALFIEELQIDKIFARPKTFDTSFKPPEKEFPAEKTVKAPAATDIADHVLKTDIEAVMNMDIRALRAFADHTFQPDKPITRAEYAMMLEDILIRATNDQGLATRFIASTSPFPDVPNDVAYYNAVMVCTSRNIMDTKDPATGEFDPMGPVSGAEALLSIRVLKTQLNK